MGVGGAERGEPTHVLDTGRVCAWLPGVGRGYSFPLARPPTTMRRMLRGAIHWGDPEIGLERPALESLTVRENGKNVVFCAER